MNASALLVSIRRLAVRAGAESIRPAVRLVARAAVPPAVIFAVLVTGPAVPAGAAPHRPLSDAAAFTADTDAWMEALLERFPEVPSFAIAVVVEDEVVMAKGYGLAVLDPALSATGETVYYIASATKPFTALAAAMLEAQGKIDLDDTLAAHAPGVAFDPAVRADEVPLRSLLTHTSGVSNTPIGFRVAYSGEHDPELLWDLLASSTPNEEAPLGTFRYTNAGYNILTILLDRELGTPWQDLLRDEIFRPAGMAHTTAYASLPRREGWPMAAPYFGIHPDGIQRVPLEKQDNTMQSAGGMMTTAADLARWLELQMNEGRVDGRQVVDAAVLRETQGSPVDTGGEGRPPFGQTGYSLGWSHGSWREHPMLHHSGGFAGWRSLVSFLPGERIGVAVLSNEGTLGARLADAVAVRAYDWWLGVAEGEQAADGMADSFAEMRDQQAPRLAESFAERAKREWMLTRPFADYTGTFENTLYGTVRITEKDGAVEVRQGNLHCVATPYTKEDTMRVELVPGSGRVVAFEFSEDGVVERIVLDGDVYERVSRTGS